MDSSEIVWWEIRGNCISSWHLSAAAVVDTAAPEVAACAEAEALACTAVALSLERPDVHQWAWQRISRCTKGSNKVQVIYPLAR